MGRLREGQSGKLNYGPVGVDFDVGGQGDGKSLAGVREVDVLRSIGVRPSDARHVAERKKVVRSDQSISPHGWRDLLPAPFALCYGYGTR